jgi:ribosome-associated protein
MPRLDKTTRVAVAALEDVKGRDITVFDVKKITSMFDTVVVATGDSNRQCRALASRVRDEVKAAGGHVYGMEGEDTGEWVLVDLGDTIVHVMQPAIRQHYNLEELWTPPAAPKPPKTPKPAKTRNTGKPGKAVKPKASAGGKARKTARSATPAAPRARAGTAKKAATRKRRTATAG